MFVDDPQVDRAYRGYNPAFWRRVQAKRDSERRQRAEARAREALARKAKEREIAKARAEAALVRVQKEREARMDAAQRSSQQSAREIGAAFAAAHGVLWEEIIGPSRARAVVSVRQATIRAVHEAKPSLSLTQLGRVFSRDHTTILHALRRTAA